MMRLRSVIAVAVTAFLLVTAARAQEPIRFARTPDISPDGKQVAFSYLGDIWIVETIGGIARPVTMHEAHDIAPVFSPNGHSIAFSSNRHGSYDVFVTRVEGGRPRRLTYDSAADMINAWSPDGQQILFASTRSTDFPPSYKLYTVPVTGGRVHCVGVTEGKEGVFSPKGDRIAYVRGPGTWYRKGYRGSSNDDIWICHADGTHNERLTRFIGQDNSPMWSPDGQYIYYVSEYFSTPANRVANIVRRKAAEQSKPEQITFHTTDSVRRARMSRNGEWMVYECGPDIWVASTRPGGPAPRKLAIEVHADDKTNPERIVTFTHGASEFAISADEKHVAFVVHGQLFLMPISGGKATRLTESTAYDHGLAWSPDSQKIIFASDRNGHEDLYLLESDDPETRYLVKAHKFKVKQLTDTPEAEVGVGFSPNGKRVAFIRSGKLWTMKPDGTDQRIIVNDVEVFDYDWSPDSKWLVYARMDGSLASELYIIPAEGAPAPKVSASASKPGTAPTIPAGVPATARHGRNITRYATYNGGVTWSNNGKKVGFISQRQNHFGMYVISLEKPAAAGATEPRGVNIDWEDIHLRVERPAPIESEEGAISPDGTKVAFRSVGRDGNDLWVAATSGGKLARITTGNMRPQQIQWSRRSEAIYFRDGSGHLRVARPGLGLFGGGSTVIPFQAKMVIRREEEFQEMFEESWRALRDNFYDPKFHGANWEAIRQKYRPLVKHVALKEDLYALISLMTGELNASHLGIRGFLNFPEETTADLGLLFDPQYSGPGLKIAEVLKRGPADKRGLNLKAGDIIRSIDRVELMDNTNLSQLLNDKAGEVVLLQVADSPNADAKSWRRVQIQAAPRHQIADLMYDRWVEHNARRVAELSKGQLGYIHIPSMDEEGLDRFLRALYSDNYDKDAIVLDVRFNSGGFTHDQVLNYLGAHVHTYFRQRDGGVGPVLRSYDRKWAKPLVLLINNRSYSDAEIFPSAFRTLKLGKLVGQPTGGHVIGTSAVRLIDGSQFRVPRIGVFTVMGVDMEQQGVVPDVMVEQTPDQEARGEDPQLDKAVEVLVQDVVAWKKAHPHVALRSDDGKPASAAGTTPQPGTAPIGK